MTGSTAIEGMVTTDVASEQAESRFLWPPIIIAVVLLWIVPMGSSLGNDEASNWWVVKDGLKEAVARANGSQSLPGGQSILYNLLPIAAQAIGGDSEIVLRFPSVLAMCGAVYLLYRLGARLVGPLAGMFSCLAFISLGDIVPVASTVRPYALGMLFVIGAMLALVRWFDTGGLRYAIAYVLLAALSIYTQYLFGVMFLVHALYAFMRFRAGDAVPNVRALLLAWAASSVAILPLAAQAVRLYSTRSQHVYTPTPDVWGLLHSLAPPILTGTIGLGILLSLAMRRGVALTWAPAASTGWFLATWALAPPLILFVISWCSETKVFVPRYYLSSAPALALLAGTLMRAVQPASVRRAVATVVTVCSVLQFGVFEKFTRGTEGWRGVAEAVREHVGNQHTPVLAVSGFIEARNPAAILDPDRIDVLFAPLLRYLIVGRLVRLPSEFSLETELYVESVIIPQIQGEREFLLFGLGSVEDYEHWLRGRLGGTGFSARTYGYYDGIKLVLFERRQEPPARQ